MRASDDTQTLDELDPPAWGPPTYSSYLVQECHRLRTKPLGEMSTEDLRILLGQKICPDILVPRAFRVLEENPLAAGDFYDGDLFVAVCKQDEDFWESAPELHRRAVTVATRVLDLIKAHDGNNERVEAAARSIIKLGG